MTPNERTRILVGQTARACLQMLDQIQRQAVSVLENYGDHHEWCEGKSEADCSCGFIKERAALAQRLTENRDAS